MAKHSAPSGKNPIRIKSDVSDVICKFYPNCANPHCHFLHDESKVKLKETSCKFFPCKNINCPFFHTSKNFEPAETAKPDEPTETTTTEEFMDWNEIEKSIAEFQMKQSPMPDIMFDDLTSTSNLLFGNDLWKYIDKYLLVNISI